MLERQPRGAGRAGASVCCEACLEESSGDVWTARRFKCDDSSHELSSSAAPLLRASVLRAEPCIALLEVLLITALRARSLPEQKTTSNERHEQQWRAGEQALSKRRAGMPYLP